MRWKGVGKKAFVAKRWKPIYVERKVEGLRILKMITYVTLHIGMFSGRVCKSFRFSPAMWLLNSFNLLYTRVWMFGYSWFLLLWVISQTLKLNSFNNANYDSVVNSISKSDNVLRLFTFILNLNHNHIVNDYLRYDENSASCD